MTEDKSTVVVEDLKPCPFCGGEAHIEQTSRNGLKLKCKSCLMGISQKTLYRSLDWLKRIMIEGWNKRDVVDDKFEFAEWVGENYVKMHGGWFHRFGDQRKIYDLKVTKFLYNQYISSQSKTKA